MRRLMLTLTLLLCSLNVMADEPTPILSSINDIAERVIEVRNNVLDMIIAPTPLRIPNDVPPKEIKCLADNIYFEAKSEPVEGQLAVAEVTLNRVASPDYPKTVCGVVWQQNKDRRTGKKVAQFSWTLDGKPDVPKSKETYEEIYALAEEVLLYGMDSDIVGPEALFYHATSVKPRWSRQMVRVMRIGNHIFYQPRT